MPVTRSSAIAAKILSDMVFFGMPAEFMVPVAPAEEVGIVNGEAAKEVNIARSLLQAAKLPHKPNAMTARKIKASPVRLRHLCHRRTSCPLETRQSTLTPLHDPYNPAECGHSALLGCRPIRTDRALADHHTAAGRRHLKSR